MVANIKSLNHIAKKKKKRKKKTKNCTLSFNSPNLWSNNQDYTLKLILLTYGEVSLL